MVALFDYSEAHEQLRAGAYPLSIEAIVELGALSLAIALGEYDPPLHTPRLISRLLPSFVPSRIPPLTNGDKLTKPDLVDALLRRHRSLSLPR